MTIFRAPRQFICRLGLNHSLRIGEEDIGGAASSTISGSMASLGLLRSMSRATSCASLGRMSSRSRLLAATRTSALTPAPLVACSTLLSNHYETHNNKLTQIRSFAVPAKNPGGNALKGRVVSVQQSLKKSKSSQPKLCSGCGVEVIRANSRAEKPITAGEEVDESTYSKKAKRKARFADICETPDKFLCQRCKSLQADNVWAAYDALRDVDPEVFSSQLKHIVSRRQFALCVMVVDATDSEFSFIRTLRKSIGKVPIILAVNKIDLLPRINQYDMKTIRSRIANNINCISAFPVSAQTGAGVVDLAEAILLELGGKDVFVVGAANVGKSTLIKKLTFILSDSVNVKEKRRKQLLQGLNVTESHLPGTTLQAIRIPCFARRGHAIWDTPGIINKSALSYALFPSHLMEPLTQPQPIPIPDKDRIVSLSAGHSVLIDATWMEEPCGLARLDILQGHVECRAYLPPSLSIRVVPTEDAPTELRIPDVHVKAIQKVLPSELRLQDEYVRPFAMFEDAPTSDKVYERTSGRYTMDVCFASLGWLALTNHKDFVVRPWVVVGSLWSKRKSIYPRNLDAYLEKHGTPEHEVTNLTEEVRKRLFLAGKDGKHHANRRHEAKEASAYWSHDEDHSLYEGQWWN